MRNFRKTHLLVRKEFVIMLWYGLIENMTVSNHDNVLW
jgi:hypothetical protein